MTDLETHSMMIITYAGMAKSSALEAIDCSERNEDYKLHIEEAEKNLKLAGEEHFKVLALSAQEEVKLNILFIHAEDQMMNAETILLLAKRMVKIFERL